MLQPPSITDSAKAAAYIQEGRIVAFPTNTSYGLAADALQGNALQRLRNLKKRPQDKTFTVFLNPTLLSSYFNITTAENNFMRQYAHKAITILLQPTEKLQHLAQDGLVGLRLIDHPKMQELADQISGPLTATSANIADQTPCYTSDCIRQAFSWQRENSTYDLSLAAILDAGELAPSAPSTIVRIKGNSVEIIRTGAQDVK